MSESAQAWSGKVALVTGASRGIGQALARRLAAHGIAVVATASQRSEAGLHETVASIIDAGGRAACVVADLADADQRLRLASEGAAAFGAPDILVNNAAIGGRRVAPSAMDLAARRQLFEVNLHAALDLIQLLLPAMRAGGWGRIVNITSDTVQQPPMPYVAPAAMIDSLCLYGASKAALDRVTVGLAAELHDSGVQVNALRPYKIALTDGARSVAAQLAATHPDWIEPLEVMAEAAWLLISGSYSGFVVSSRELLQMAQQPVHDLTGTRVLGHAGTLFPLD